MLGLNTALKGYAQPPCDPPLQASVTLSGPVCVGGAVTIFFDLDDDEDDLDVYYTISGIQYVAEDQDDDFTVEYVAYTNTTVTLQYIINDNDCITVFNQTVAITVSSPSLSISTTQPGCGQNNGVIIASASNGIPPYSYRLNGGNFQPSGTFSGLGQGTYTVTVQDNIGCTAQQSVSLTEPPPPTLSVSQTNPTCNQNNGTISATASGGMPPYEYRLDGGSWQSGGTFTGLGAGTYTVSVRDAGFCSASATVTLTASGGPVLSVSQTNPTCNQNNGAISATASGGMPPYEYRLDSGAWQSGGTFTGLGAGTYTVSVRDAGFCSATRVVNLTPSNASAPPATISSSTLIGCAETVFVLRGNQPAGTTGKWTSDEVVPLTPGNPVWMLSNAPIGTITVNWTLSTPDCPDYSMASVELTVVPPPIAYTDGVLAVEAGKSTEVSVLSNDVFILPVNVYILKQGLKGMAKVNASNQIEYLPYQDVSDLDTVIYRICYINCPASCDTALIILRNTREENPCLITGDTSYILTNGLTPNGDGKNDYLIFRVVSSEECEINYEKSEIIIYNRWGDVVYEASPYNNNWRGQNKKGEDLPPGVYYFVLRIKLDRTYTHFGSAIIIR